MEQAIINFLNNKKVEWFSETIISEVAVTTYRLDIKATVKKNMK